MVHVGGKETYVGLMQPDTQTACPLNSTLHCTSLFILPILPSFIIYVFIFMLGVRGGTALQARGWRVRFPLGSSGFFVYLILPAA
jgi:hypothetical protein